MKRQQMIIKSWLCGAKRETAKASVISLLVLALGLNLFVLVGCQQTEKITQNLPGLPNLSGFVDKVLGRSVSTDIKDAYPVAFWLDDVGQNQSPRQATTWNCLRDTIACGCKVIVCRRVPTAQMLRKAICWRRCRVARRM